MARTTAVFSRVALAVGLGVAAASAHAVPIVFDFAGTVTSGVSAIGEAVAGQIVVETDGLFHNAYTSTPGTWVTYTDLSSNPVDLITSQVSIGGNAYDVGVYSSDHSSLTAFDSSGLPACDGCAVSSDYVTVTDWSMSYWPSNASDPVPPPGEYLGRRLALQWNTPALDFVDVSNGCEPLDLVSMLTTLLPTGYFRDETWACADLRCTGTGIQQTNFRVDSLSVQTPSVPEPGTLALFGIGLLGGAVVRRAAVKGR